MLAPAAASVPPALPATSLPTLPDWPCTGTAPPGAVVSLRDGLSFCWLLMAFSSAGWNVVPFCQRPCGRSARDGLGLVGRHQAAARNRQCTATRRRDRGRRPCTRP